MGPFAAQSRDDPLPYILPATTTMSSPASPYAWETSNRGSIPPSWKLRVQPPLRPSASRFFSLTLANVPRIITSWLPRRAP